MTAAAARDLRLSASPQADSRTSPLRAVPSPSAGAEGPAPVPAGGVVLLAGTGRTSGSGQPGEGLAGPAPVPQLTVVVYGLPVPQGSKSATVRAGRAVMFEDNKRTHPWRRRIVRTLAPLVDTQPMFAGAVAVAVTFTFPPPQRTPRGRTTWPATRTSGDLDKLLRALFDAFTTAAVWVDDSRVVTVTATKVHVGHPGALDEPGAAVSVWPVAS